MLDDFGDAAGGRQRERKLRSLREPMLALGGVVPPGDESQGNRALQSVVNDVLKRHTVSRDSFKYRGASKLPRGTLRTVVGSGQRLERISGDLSFEAQPKAALSIISELEDSPAIESITSVRLSMQAGPGKVRVDLTLEAWIVGSDQRSRGLGGV